MTKAAKKWLNEYKKLFNEVSAYNKGANAAQNAVASEGVRKIERLGRVVESAEGRVQNAELDDGSRAAIKKTTQGNFVEDKYYQRQIDKIDELKQGSYITVGEIQFGSALNKIGFPNSVVYFDVSKVIKEMRTRRDIIPSKIIKAIPDVLDNPIVITEYVDNNGMHSANVYGNLYINNSPVVVGVMMAQTQKGNIISKIQTVHPNRNALKEMTDDKILYLSENKKETKSWFQSLGTQMLPWGGNKFGFIRSISQQSQKNNSFDKKTSKDFKNSVESGKNVDDGSRSALKRGGNVASELAGFKAAVSELNIDPVNLMALSDKYFGRYDGKKSRTALRIELMDAARLMADSKDPKGLDKGYEAVLRLADDLVANEKDSSGYTEQMREIQKHIREIELQVHDRDKGDFDSYGGYEQFRKRNFGKLKLGNRGVEVDSAYAELQNLYGYDVFPEVNSIAEMADVMARVGEGAPLLRGFEGDFDKQVDATAQQIYVELAEAISKGYPGKPKPRITRADAEKYIKKLDAKYEVKVARAKAKMEERASKAEAKYEKKTETKKVQLEAEYTTDKVFSQNSVKSGFESVPEIKKLPGKECETIARDLWLELEASDSQDVRDTFILKYSVKLYDAIKNADHEAYENMTMKEKDALREKLNAAVKKIVESGKKSKWAKQKDNVRGIVKLEEQVAGEIKAKMYQSLKKIDDIKKERFLAASAYKSDEFKDTLEKLTKIDWRGKFSANIARAQVRKLSEWYSEENPMFKNAKPEIEIKNKKAETAGQTRLNQPSVISIPDSAPKFNTDDKNSSKTLMTGHPHPPPRRSPFPHLGEG